MTWRLVVGAVFLERRSLIGAIVMAGLVSRPSQPWWLSGVVLWIVAATGTGAYTALGKRELVVLPSGPAEQNRAGWILTGVFPVAVLLFARVLGGAWHAISDGSFVFHASPVQILFEVVFFSVTAASTAGKPERYEPAFDEDPGLWRWVAGMLGMAVLPFVVIPILPERVSDLPVIAWVVGAAALAYGVAPLFRTPTVYKRDFPAVTEQDAAPAPAKRNQTSPVAPPATRLTGVWVPMRGVAGMAAIMTVIMLGLIAVLAHYTKAKVSLWGPFDASLTDVRFLSTVGLLPMFALGLSPSLAPWIAALKRLPISSRETALMLSLAPAMMPALYWASLLVIHLVTAWQWPDALRLGILTTLVGCASLADALGTKGGSSMVKMAAGATLLLAFTYGMDNRALMTAVVSHWALPLAGLVCFALSWLLNLHTLTHSAGSSRALRFNRSWQSARAR